MAGKRVEWPMEPSWSPTGWMPHGEFRDHIRDYDGMSPLDESFGPLPGVYLFAHCDGMPTSRDDEMQLDPTIIYIGKSMDLCRRLSRDNKVWSDAKCYRVRYADAALSKLFIAAYVLNNRFNIATRTTDNRLLHVRERAALRAFQSKFGCLPAMNQRAGRPVSAGR